MRPQGRGDATGREAGGEGERREGGGGLCGAGGVLGRVHPLRVAVGGRGAGGQGAFCAQPIASADQRAPERLERRRHEGSAACCTAACCTAAPERRV